MALTSLQDLSVCPWPSWEASSHSSVFQIITYILWMWELETRSFKKASSQWHHAQLFRYFLWQPGYFNSCLNLQITFLSLLENMLTYFTIFIPFLLQNSEEDSWWQGLQAVHPSANLFSVTGMALTMCIHPHTSWCDSATAICALELLICYMSSSLPLGCSPTSPT